MTLAPTHPVRSKAGHTLAVLVLFMAGLVLLPGRVGAQSAPLTEYGAKAALLFNIAKYADWPAEAFPRPDSPIVIGVLGDDPFGAVLDRIVQGRTVNGRPFLIRRAGGISDLKGAHLVFISPAESHAAQDWAVLEGFHILTVGDTAQSSLFTAFNFAIEGDRIVFTVDLNRAKRAGVNLSSKLLTLAKAVKRTSETEPR